MDGTLVPAAYARRVDNALDHLIQAVESPLSRKRRTFKERLSKSPTFQQELQELRTRIKVKSNVDALAALRNVQLTAAQSIDIDAAAGGGWSLYMERPTAWTSSRCSCHRDRVSGCGANVVAIGVEVEPTPEGLKIVDPVRSRGPTESASW